MGCGLKLPKMETQKLKDGVFIEVETPEECQLLCQETHGCLGFTWIRDWAECHLKECLPIPVDGSEIGCVSGPRMCGNCNLHYF
jgi:hypothetical protein